MVEINQRFGNGRSWYLFTFNSWLNISIPFIAKNF
jgi:hypothetical protein